MIERLTSFRVWLLVAMLATALVTILAFLQPITSDVRPIVRGTAVIVIAAVVSGTLVEAWLPAAIGSGWLRPLLVLRVAPAALACLAVVYQGRHLDRPPVGPEAEGARGDPDRTAVAARFQRPMLAFWPTEDPRGESQTSATR